MTTLLNNIELKSLEDNFVGTAISRIFETKTSRGQRETAGRSNRRAIRKLPSSFLLYVAEHSELGNRAPSAFGRVRPISIKVCCSTFCCTSDYPYPQARLIQGLINYLRNEFAI
jgi:hypothetical protein